MPGDSDARVIANAQRQAELQARHRDLTKPVPPVGSTPESIRDVKGFEGITDAMLDERATFNLQDHMKGMGKRSIAVNEFKVEGLSGDGRMATLDLQRMTEEELHGLAGAALSELEQRNKENSNA